MARPMKDYCNCLALERGLDPIGHAGSFEDSIVIEVPLPWKRDLYYDDNVLPQGIRDLLALWNQRYHETGEYNHRPLVIAPDEAYSREGFRRVMHYTRQKGRFAHFDKVEYLVPTEQLGVLVWSLYEAQSALPRFEPYRVRDGNRIRDILVCTHGTIDAACSKFGYPLFRHMRETYADDQLRVWRVSHFGGHVFAPTLMDMPTGHYWAYVENEQAAQIVQRTGEVARLRGHYRGWAGLDDSFLQTAECALWQQHGWAWFDAQKSGEIVLKDTTHDDPQWADVQVKWSAAGSDEVHSARLRIEISHMIETPPSTGKSDSHAYPQYRVAETEKSSA